MKETVVGLIALAGFVLLVTLLINFFVPILIAVIVIALIAAVLFPKKNTPADPQPIRKY